MALFMTDYAEGVGTYGAYIEADNLGHARQLAAQRGMNERVRGRIEAPALPNRLRDLIREENWLEAAHEACFLGFVGLISGALTPRDVLGDHGLVHEMLHLLRFKPHHPDEAPDIVAEDLAERDVVKAHVAALAAQCEWRTPGWPPSGGQPGVRHFNGDEELDP